MQIIGEGSVPTATIKGNVAEGTVLERLASPPTGMWLYSSFLSPARRRCLHVCAHPHRHRYAHTCTCTHTTRSQTHVQTHSHEYRETHTHECTHTGAHMKTYTHIHLHIHARACTCVHVHTHTPFLLLADRHSHQCEIYFLDPSSRLLLLNRQTYI